MNWYVWIAAPRTRNTNVGPTLRIQISLCVSSSRAASNTDNENPTASQSAPERIRMAAASRSLVSRARSSSVNREKWRFPIKRNP